MPDAHLPPASTQAIEESSRYALLRRLAPTLRHHMVGEFQPIGMLAALMERRLDSAPLNLPGLRENCQSIGNLSRSAADSCLELMSWLAPRQPGQSQAVAVNEGVAQCLSLLATSLRFRGFSLVNRTGEFTAQVSCTALRSVLPAALIALSDGASGPSDLVISAGTEAGSVRLSITLTPAERAADNPSADDYRALTWHDVEVLAQAELVTLSRDGQQTHLTLALSA